MHLWLAEKKQLMRNRLSNFFYMVFLVSMKISFLSNSYAEDLFPAYLIEIPDSIENILIADTENATLIHYSAAKKKLIKNYEYYMSIGQHGPGKRSKETKKLLLVLILLRKN